MEYFSLFGGQLKSHHKETYAKSSQWDGTKFVNLEETVMEFSWSDLPELLRKQFFDKENREPSHPIPIVPFDRQAFLAPSDQMKYIWYGHSVVLLRLAGKTLLIDPMLGDNASPIAPFATKRFSPNTLSLIEDFPEIDLLLMTHDHYDHLDYASIQALKSRVKHYFVALGVGRHLEEWGIAPEKITEFDWWDAHPLADIQITFTPSRHFSGRGLTDRAKSLWGGWAFKTETEALYFSGDGGYGHHFKDIGSRLGPFDFGWMECGQYNKSWHQIHMYPEESVQAALDAGVQQATPVHWAGFALAQHDWDEPANRFWNEANKQGMPLLLPAPGELLSDRKKVYEPWWKALS
ncbi:MAG: MBL fold metallo-hydrolase [Bacteroidota bacterium]